MTPAAVRTMNNAAGGLTTPQAPEGTSEMPSAEAGSTSGRGPATIAHHQEFHRTCSRCGAGIEFSTDGNGNLLERESPCTCAASWRRFRERAAAVTKAVRRCADCPRPVSRVGAKRCLACAHAEDLRQMRVRNGVIRQWAVEHATPGFCLICGEPVCQRGRMHKGACTTEARHRAMAEAHA